MSLLLQGASLISLGPPSVETSDLRIDSGLISDRSSVLEVSTQDEVIDLRGKLVLPGMVCAHTHLYSALARGMPPPPRPPANFLEILQLIWWRLDHALDEEAIYWSALIGALEAARAGTTCLFDHHSSPSNITGSLSIVREAIERVGLRGVLCYEVTDRAGAPARDQGIGENRAFLSFKKDRNPNFRGLVGAHASFTLSDESLELCGALVSEFQAGLHIHVAEDSADIEDATARYGIGVVERLSRFGALNDRTILVHGTHLSDRDIQIAIEAGAWFAHNPRSNMNNKVGYAPVLKFGDKVVLGTDGIDGNMFEEGRVAFFKSQDARTGLSPEYWLDVLSNNHRLASGAFGLPIGSLEEGSVADLIILDYKSPTPITADNLPWHFAFGMSSSAVESVIVNGRFVVKERRAQLDEDSIYAEAHRVSEKLWSRLR